MRNKKLLLTSAIASALMATSAGASVFDVGEDVVAAEGVATSYNKATVGTDGTLGSAVDTSATDAGTKRSKAVSYELETEWVNNDTLTFDLSSPCTFEAAGSLKLAFVDPDNTIGLTTTGAGGQQPFSLISSSSTQAVFRVTDDAAEDTGMNDLTQPGTKYYLVATAASDGTGAPTDRDDRNAAFDISGLTDGSSCSLTATGETSTGLSLDPAGTPTQAVFSAATQFTGSIVEAIDNTIDVNEGDGFLTGPNTQGTNNEIDVSGNSGVFVLNSNASESIDIENLLQFTTVDDSATFTLTGTTLAGVTGISDILNGSTAFTISGDDATVTYDGSGTPLSSFVSTLSDTLNVATEITVDPNAALATRTFTGDFSISLDDEGIVDSELADGDAGGWDKNASEDVVTFLTKPDGAFASFVRITNPTDSGGSVDVTLFNDAGDSVRFALSDVVQNNGVNAPASLGANASTDIIAVEDLFTAAQAEDPNFEVGDPSMGGSNKLRIKVEGQFGQTTNQGDNTGQGVLTGIRIDAFTTTNDAGNSFFNLAK